MDSSVILDYLAGVDPRIAALTPSKAPQRLAALRATGLALTVMEKAVQRHYERMLRPAEKRHEPWVDRVMSQLTAGLSALDAELPGSGWIGGELGIADISVACAFGFTRSVLADVVETGRYPNLGGVLRPGRSAARVSRRSAGGWGDGLRDRRLTKRGRAPRGHPAGIRGSIGWVTKATGCAR